MCIIILKLYVHNIILFELTHLVRSRYCSIPIKMVYPWICLYVVEFDALYHDVCDLI